MPSFDRLGDGKTSIGTATGCGNIVGFPRFSPSSFGFFRGDFTTSTKSFTYGVPSVATVPSTPTSGASKAFSNLVPPVTVAKVSATFLETSDSPIPLNKVPFLRSISGVYPGEVWSTPYFTTSSTSSKRYARRPVNVSEGYILAAQAKEL